jgi:hypothetical protein
MNDELQNSVFPVPCSILKLNNKKWQQLQESKSVNCTIN